jgi:prepilin-type N-terminal cleavage/methylation domain-containing protein
MDNLPTMNTKGNKHDRFGRGLPSRALAFTLIEMLTVITIMGIVAALVVTMGGAAKQKTKIAQVSADETKLVGTINNYKNILNYFPPDNGWLVSPLAGQTYDGLAATNPLLYELTGASNYNQGAKPGFYVFNSTSANTILTASAYSGVFNRGGIANGDASEPHDFFQPDPAPKEYAVYANTTPLPIYGLVVPVELTNAAIPNFWHYDSSSPYRHNMNSFDLWAEFSIGGKGGHPTIMTNGNWSSP